MLKYRVGDLFCASWDEKELYIITRKSEKDVYSLTCMRTYKVYGYNKESIESLFRKVA